LSPNLDPFDRTTYSAQALETATTDAAADVALHACYTQGLMLLQFLRALRTQLTHEEALVLAGQVWRPS
jgi:hypothetical protein